MSSLTIDDIFHDYSYSSIPISCNKQGDNGIIKNFKRNIIDNLKFKHYIKKGDICSICFDEIWNRNNAFLTDCGHCFHYNCVINYELNNYFSHYGVLCPICRQDMGNYTDIKDKYPYSKNEIDKLIDFENNINFKIPKTCFNFHINHFNSHFHLLHYNHCYYCYH